MIRTLFTGLATILSLTAIAQNNEKPKETSAPEAEVFMMTDQQPEFPGNLVQFLNERLNYPQSARDSNIQGRVVIKFIVDVEGNVTSPEVVRSVDKTLDEEALRVVRAMPKWKPGKLDGKAVNCYFTLPITFRLQ